MGIIIENKSSGTLALVPISANYNLKECHLVPFKWHFCGMSAMQCQPSATLVPNEWLNNLKILSDIIKDFNTKVKKNIWLFLGISRRTYYRRKYNGKI
jgi:hypothetical protein